MAAAVSNGGGELRRAALARVPGCEAGQAPVSVVPLQGGTSNATFRVQTHAGAFVMRLNEPEAAELGVNREREVLLHRAAAAAGLAAPVVWADAAGRFLITEYVAGAAWSASEMGDARSLERLGELLARVHALPPPPVAPFALQPLLEHHAARAYEAQPGESAQLARFVRRARRILEAAGAARAPCVIHNDLHHSNILAAGARLLLVDWEYAAVADPLYDLACLLAYYPQAEPHAARLLEAAGLAVRSTVAHLTELAWVYVLLSYLWYRTRGGLAPPSAVDRETERALRRRLGD